MLAVVLNRAADPHILPAHKPRLLNRPVERNWTLSTAHSQLTVFADLDLRLEKRPNQSQLLLVNSSSVCPVLFLFLLVLFASSQHNASISKKNRDPSLGLQTANVMVSSSEHSKLVMIIQIKLNYTATSQTLTLQTETDGRHDNIAFCTAWIAPLYLRTLWRYTNLVLL